MSAFYDLASLVLVPSGYKASKIYAQKPLTTDGQLTFSRASTATRVNASGLIETVASGVPRLDYQGSTCPKLLLEPQRSNVALRSQELSTSPWGRGTNIATLTVTANQATAPDGTTTAEKLEFSAVTTLSEYAVCFQPFTALASTYTLSVYLRGQSGGETVYLSFTKDGINYTRQLCTLTTAWQRFTLTSTLTAGADNFQIGIDRRDSSQGAAPAQTIYAWGCQLEAGTYATSYIPTTSAAVTRLADAASKTGISSLMPSTEGTVFIDADINFDNSNFTILGSTYVNGGTMFANSVYFYINNNKIDGQIWNTPAFTGWTGLSPSLANGRHKLAISWKANDFAYYIDGNLIASSTAYSAVPTGMNRLDVGDYYGSYGTNNKYNQLLIFKIRLTNAQLAELTTL